MRYRVICFFALTSLAPAATVSTSAYCYLRSPWNPVIGTYFAACSDAWTEDLGYPGRQFYDSERAEIRVGSSVTALAGTYASSFAAGGASATFSAHYMLTLTGASNLPDPIPGSLMLFVPCLLVNGSWDSYASMGGAIVSGSGNSCGSTWPSGLSPIQLNVPTPLELDLYVRSGFLHDNLAQFTGEFRFFGFNGYTGPLTELTDVSYTFTLNDTLPIPEPDCLVLTMIVLLTLLPSARLRFSRKLL